MNLEQIYIRDFADAYLGDDLAHIGAFGRWLGSLTQKRIGRTTIFLSDLTYLAWTYESGDTPTFGYAHVEFYRPEAVAGVAGGDLKTCAWVASIEAAFDRRDFEAIGVLDGNVFVDRDAMPELPKDKLLAELTVFRLQR